MRAFTFFRVVPLHSTYMLVGLGALGVLGLVTLSLDPGRGIDTVMPVLLLHMFAVSSGFAVPARRGHFDVLFTTGLTRGRIAVGHWVMSVAPGVVVWMCLGIAEWIVGGPGAVFSNGTVAAVALISSLGWALTVPLPRLGGGVIWLVTLFIVLASSGDWRAALLHAAERGGGGWEMAAMFLLCPLFFVGVRVDGREMLSLVPGLAIGAMALAVAVAWIIRFDIALEASQ